MLWKFKYRYRNMAWDGVVDASTKDNARQVANLWCQKTLGRAIVPESIRPFVDADESWITAQTPQVVPVQVPEVETQKPENPLLDRLKAALTK